MEPANGERTIISGADYINNSGIGFVTGDSVGSGPGFIVPKSVAVEADGSLVVVDFGLRAVFRVNPVSGDRTIISDASIGSGPGLGFPEGIAVEADGSLVVTTGVVPILRTGIGSS